MRRALIALVLALMAALGGAARAGDKEDAKRLFGASFSETQWTYGAGPGSKFYWERGAGPGSKFHTQRNGTPYNQNWIKERARDATGRSTGGRGSAKSPRR